MADYLPVYIPAHTITATTSAAVTGGQTLAVSGDGTVGPAGATSASYIGVAGHDAASGARVTVYARGMVHETTASGNITAGAQVVAGAAGTVTALAAAVATIDETDVNDARAVIGVALTTATDTNKVRWMAW